MTNFRIGEVLVSLKALECMFDQRQKLKNKIQGIKSKANQENRIIHNIGVRAEEYQYIKRKYKQGNFQWANNMNKQFKRHKHLVHDLGKC